MQYIQPNKRGKAKAEPINIIDVNADDLRPASSEWLKTITDKVLTLFENVFYSLPFVSKWIT
jgi:hypothetical protein